MLEMLKYYAKCNQIINAEIIKLIEANTNAFDYSIDSFFKNIGEILDHQYKADLIWLNSFKSIKDYTIYKDPVFAVPQKYEDRYIQSIADLKIKRPHLDSIWQQLMEEISEDDLGKSLSRVTRSGEKMEKIFWKALMHVFNHQTHHRGAISQIFDQMKISNDFSNMIRIE